MQEPTIELTIETRTKRGISKPKSRKTERNPWRIKALFNLRRRGSKAFKSKEEISGVRIMKEMGTMQT